MVFAVHTEHGIIRLTISSYPMGTIKDSLGYAAPEDVYIGKTFSSREGVKLTGTMPGLQSG